MKFPRFTFVLGCALALCSASYGQARAVAPTSNSEASPATTSPTTGKLEVTFDITIGSTWIPTSDTIGAEVTANVEGETGTFHEVAAGACSRSGDHASCTVTFRYSWLLQHPGSDSINLTYEVAVPPEGTGNLTLPYRESSQSGVITPVPTSGAITRLTVDFTL